MVIPLYRTCFPLQLSPSRKEHRKNVQERIYKDRFNSKQERPWYEHAIQRKTGRKAAPLATGPVDLQSKFTQKHKINHI